MQFAFYRFHIALQHITRRIWQRVELGAEYSLADLQRVIQIGMDWSDEYQHRFTIRNHLSRQIADFVTLPSLSTNHRSDGKVDLQSARRASSPPAH